MLNEQKATCKIGAMVGVDVKGYAESGYTHTFGLSDRTDSQLRISEQAAQRLRNRKIKLKT